MTPKETDVQWWQQEPYTLEGYSVPDADIHDIPLILKEHEKRVVAEIMKFIPKDDDDLTLDQIRDCRPLFNEIRYRLSHLSPKAGEDMK